MRGALSAPGHPAAALPAQASCWLFFDLSAFFFFFFFFLAPFSAPRSGRSSKEKREGMEPGCQLLPCPASGLHPPNTVPLRGSVRPPGCLLLVKSPCSVAARCPRYREFSLLTSLSRGCICRFCLRRSRQSLGEDKAAAARNSHSSAFSLQWNGYYFIFH